jgi:hypothetical protein
MARSRRMAVNLPPVEPLSRDELLAAHKKMFDLMCDHIREWPLTVIEATIKAIREYDDRIIRLASTAAPAVNENGR